MFIGHYAVAFAARGLEKRIPLWGYFIAVQWVDIAWCVLVYFGIERVSIAPGINPSVPLVFNFYPYTHSLAAGVAWAAIAFMAYQLVTPARDSWWAASVLALVVFSHWIMDFIVHQPDLDLINEGYKVGLGLWNHPALESIVEFLLAACGLLFYFKKSPELSITRRIAMIALLLVMAAVQLASNFGPPPPSVRVMAISGFAVYLLFAALALFVEGGPKVPGTDVSDAP